MPSFDDDLPAADVIDISFRDPGKARTLRPGDPGFDACEARR